MKANINLTIALGLTFIFAAALTASYPVQEQSEGQQPLPINQEIVGMGRDGLQLSPAEARAMRLYLLSWLQNLGSMNNDRVKAKRTCLLNAGLSHSCDYKDTLAAIDEGYFLGSDQTPGKK